jgi:hypothetical protein
MPLIEILDSSSSGSSISNSSSSVSGSSHQVSYNASLHPPFSKFLLSICLFIIPFVFLKILDRFF